jgi:hypothetical protein
LYRKLRVIDTRQFDYDSAVSLYLDNRLGQTKSVNPILDYLASRLQSIRFELLIIQYISRQEHLEAPLQVQSIPDGNIAQALRSPAL